MKAEVTGAAAELDADEGVGAPRSFLTLIFPKK